MLAEDRFELLQAMETILDSQALFEEFENADYHSAWEFMGELRTSIEDGDPIGYNEWDEDDEA